ncbi:MAG: afr 6, partial [Phycisphaerales bacterium]|nr:afr 6 [Phycisphaerales bacterium]
MVQAFSLRLLPERLRHKYILADGDFRMRGSERSFHSNTVFGYNHPRAHEGRGPVFTRVHMKNLNIGLIGYGFMGRTHSNAYRRVPNFFDLQYTPVLKAVCGRDEAKLKEFAGKWGYESTETDWRKVVERKDIDVIDI